MLYQRLITYQRLKDEKSILLNSSFLDSTCCNWNNINYEERSAILETEEMITVLFHGFIISKLWSWA